MAKTLQERLQQATRAKEFVGRETELAFFQQLLGQEEPDYLFLLVHGIGGVGKTWLLNRWEAQARAKDFAVARVDEDQNSVEQILKKFRDDFEKQGYKFETFDKSYQKFRQLKSDAERALGQWETQQEDGIARSAGQMTGRSLTVLAELFSPTKKAVELVGGSEKVEQACVEGFSYLRKKFEKKEDLEFLEGPLLHLTRSFVGDLNRVCDKKRVVLFFDTYEYLAPFSNEWLCKLLLKEELSEQILWIFAGRDVFSPCWQDYQPLIKQIPLEVFTDEEAKAYLSSHGITAPELIEDILSVSGRLPVYLAMLTTQAQSGIQDLASPAESVVERFLKWIPQHESLKRRAVVACAFPRVFNKDVVREVMQTYVSEEEPESTIEDLFTWLQKQPFISARQHGWMYHERVRTELLRDTCRKSRQDYRKFHQTLLDYYRQQLPNEKPEEELYHLFSIDPEQGLQFGLAGLFRAATQDKYWKHWVEQVEEITRQIESESSKKDEWSQKLKASLEQIRSYAPESEAILRASAENEQFELSVRAEAYLFLGLLFQKQQRMTEAEQAYRQSINFNPKYAAAYYNLGVLLREVQRPEEAEQAFRQAIACDPKLVWAYGSLGFLLRNQQRGEEAEQAFRQAMELQPKDWSTCGRLGWLCYLLKKWNESIEWSRQGLALDPTQTWIQFNLALALLCRGNVDEAKVEYQKGLELSDAKDLNDAITDLQKALEMSPDLPGAQEILAILQAHTSAS